MADVKENKNPQGFYFNQQACIGCRTCQVACKDRRDTECTPWGMPTTPGM